MKRVLYFAVIYVASMLLGTLVFATLFMFGCNLTMLVTGSTTSFYSLHFFVKGILAAIPLVCVLIQVLLVLYTIRHPASHILSWIMYLLLGLLSWLVIIPTDVKLIERYDSGVESFRVTSTSAGVFRKEDSGVYYFSRIGDDGKAEGIFLDTTGFLGHEGTAIPLFDYEAKNESAFPYSDIIIKNSLEPPRLVSYPLAVYDALLTAARYASSLGFLSWLAFASLGLSLLSVYGVQFTSSWKLANVSCVITASAVILFMNYLYYMHLMPPMLKEIAEKLSDLTGHTDSLIVLANLVIAVLLALFGLFMGIYRLRGESVLESSK